MTQLRIMLLAALAGALLLLYSSRVEIERETGRQQIRNQYAALAKGINEKRAAVAPKVEAQVQKEKVRIETVYKTITKEVLKYVKNDTCTLSPGFRVLHDAAANAQLPRDSGIAQAAPVPVADLAETITANYEGCQQNVNLIEGWQKWAEEQEKVK